MNFGGNGTFNLGTNNQAVTGVALVDSFTGTVTGVGSLTVNSGSLTVGPGQMVDFKIGAVLRQSMATVHDPN